MPKNALDYSNTFFYKIVCKDLGITDCYVGHTTNFKQRKSLHKHDCIKESSKNHNFQVYRFIREHGGWDNWDMIVIEQCECKDALEATARERYWYEQVGATLNKCVPNRGQQEAQKAYYVANREQKLEYRKAYYEANREQELDRGKAYYEANREQIKIKRNVFVECECGGKYILVHKSRHFKTRKHQMWQCQPSNNLST